MREFVKNYVREEKLSPGDQLPSELELSRRLGISRSAVREAITSLKSMGIVDVRHGNGLFLGTFSFEPLVSSLPFGLMNNERPLAELVEIRRVLEVALVPRVIELKTPTYIASVRATLSEMKAAAERGDSVTELDREFHRRLFSILDNSTLIELLDVFWFAFRQARQHTPIKPTTPMDTYQTHARIAEAIENGDTQRAAVAVAQHYQEVIDRLTTSNR